MKTIWFVYPYGPLPTEKSLECRYARFGRVLAQNGYKCVWWTANFNHGNKERRTDSWATIEVCPNFSIELVPTPSYKKNISIRRVFFELAFANNLKKKFSSIPAPDLIMTSGTGLFTAFRPIWPYMKNKNVPVIYDIMDVHMINAYMKSHNKMLAPMVKLATMFINLLEKSFYNNVKGVCALGRNQLDIALERAGNRNIPSCLVYNGIYLEEFQKQMLNNAPKNLPQKQDGWIWCVYAGNLGPSYDMGTVIEAARIAKAKEEPITFIIAGAGPQEEEIRNEAKINNHIVFLGILRPDELGPVYKKCDIGLCTYADFSTVDMPDKFYDYCSSGLAIVNSLKGEVREHIMDNNLGVNYIPGDANSLYCAIKQLADTDLEGIKERAELVAPKFDMKSLIIPLVKMIDEITEAQ